LPLGSVKLKSGKLVHAWAFEGDCDPTALMSNTFELEWPRRSGRKLTVPEIDRADFFTLATACEKINPAQQLFLTRLTRVLETE
jgi:predicted NUDIX family NTP pyrophosphohydrolase